MEWLCEGNIYYTALASSEGPRLFMDTSRNHSPLGSADTAVASADYEDLLGVAMGHHGDLGYHFLVGELVVLYHLDDTIEDQDHAVGDRFEEEEVLGCSGSVAIW